MQGAVGTENSAANGCQNQMSGTDSTAIHWVSTSPWVICKQPWASCYSLLYARVNSAFCPSAGCKM